jgi:hypothetical protein
MASAGALRWVEYIILVYLAYGARRKGGLGNRRGDEYCDERLKLRKALMLLSK